MTRFYFIQVHDGAEKNTGRAEEYDRYGPLSTFMRASTHERYMNKHLCILQHYHILWLHYATLMHSYKHIMFDYVERTKVK